MAKKSSTVSDAVVDLEKGTTALKEVEKEEEVAIVDPEKAKPINRVMNVYLVLYLLFNVGLVAYMVKFSDNGPDLWVCLFILSLTLIGNVWLISKTRELYIKNYAMKQSMEGVGDLSTKLLASEK